MEDKAEESVSAPEKHAKPRKTDKWKKVYPASAVAGGREVSRKILYVGNLHKSVSDEMLNHMFSAAGAIHSIKMINDKNKPGFNYAFLEYETSEMAETALHTLNGQMLGDFPLKLNWAYQSSTINTAQNPQQPSYNIFVGDLSPEVDDESLYRAFSGFVTLVQAHVMWDMQTSRSRGYGFVTFGTQEDASLALQTMNGQIIQGRAIRCNWAEHKQMHNQRRRRQLQFYKDIQPLIQPPLISPHSYDMVLCQTPSWQTTVYLGNLAHFTQQNDIVPLVRNFGYIVNFKLHPERGCAFVKYDSHESAALAIVQLAGFNLNGRPLKCGWGKERQEKDKTEEKGNDEG